MIMMTSTISFKPCGTRTSTICSPVRCSKRFWRALVGALLWKQYRETHSPNDVPSIMKIAEMWSQPRT